MLPSHAATEKEQRRSDLRTVASLLPYLWPTDDAAARLRVMLAMASLALAKLANVYVPILYKYAIDALTPTTGTGGPWKPS